MGDGVGLVCLVLSSGSVFTGCLLKPTGGTQSIGAPSRIGSLRGLFVPLLFLHLTNEYARDINLYLCIFVLKRFILCIC